MHAGESISLGYRVHFAKPYAPYKVSSVNRVQK